MFTGTTQQQDTRFSDKEKKLMKSMKFGDCLNKRVDMSKVKMEVLRPWIGKKITEMLNIEDDVVVEFVCNQLEGERYPCPKKMQINMTGFLNGRNARQFMGDLWALLLSAQDSETGIPAEFIERKKEEIVRREEEQRRSRERERDRQKERNRSRSRDKDSEKERRRERSKSRKSKSASPKEMKSRHRSPSRNHRSRDVSRQRSTPRRQRSRRNTPRNDSDRRKSPKTLANRNSIDRRGNKSSRSPSPQKVGRSRDSKSKSPRSPRRQRSPSNRRSRSKSSVRVKNIQNGKKPESDEKLKPLHQEDKESSDVPDRRVSRRNSFRASPPGSPAKSMDERARKRGSRSRSISRRNSSRRTKSRSGSNLPSRRGSLRRSISRRSSISLSPERRQDNFNMRRNKDSVQNKRQYRNNRDSSHSSVERDGRRPQFNNRRWNNYGQTRRFSPRGRSPRNSGGSNYRRSRSPRRSRSRMFSRSPMRYSRSPRRFNRRTPMFFNNRNFRGRGGGYRNQWRGSPNGMRNNWRRSPSRGRFGYGGRFDRRRSPFRRFSRERRSPPMRNSNFRNRSPSPALRSPPPSRRRSREMRHRSHSSRIASGSPRSSPNRDSHVDWDEEPRSINRRVRTRSRSASSSVRSNREKPIIRRSLEVVDKPRMVSPVNDRIRRSSSTARDVAVSRRTKSSSLSADSDESEREEKPVTRPKEVVNDANSQLSLPIEAEISRKSSSLSRTPSPFLKPHERRAATFPDNQAARKNSAPVKKAAAAKDQESESTSSDSSDDSDDNSEDEQKVKETKRSKLSEKEVDLKRLTRHSSQPITKRPTKRARSSSTDQSSGDERNDSTKHAIKKRPSNVKSANRSTESSTRQKLDEPEVSDKHLVPKPRDTTKDKSLEHSKKPLKKDVPLVATKAPADDDNLNRKRGNLHEDSVASSDLNNSKKKLKKAKKRSRRGSDGEDSDSDSEAEQKKKKHKKHKKHSKKSKKHKKHKKRSKRTETSSSSSSSSSEDEKRTSRNGKVSTTVLGSGGAPINDDLEKQLRERALRSMKKYD